jgi:hypothetical protein
MKLTPEIQAQLEDYVVPSELYEVNCGYANWYIGLLVIYAGATPDNFWEIDTAVEQAHTNKGHGDLKSWWDALVRTKYFIPPIRTIISRRT